MVGIGVAGINGENGGGKGECVDTIRGTVTGATIGTTEVRICQHAEFEILIGNFI